MIATSHTHATGKINCGKYTSNAINAINSITQVNIIITEGQQ